MGNLRLREAAPTAVNVTVGKRSREYLTDREVERLIEAAKQNRSGHRDATAILVAYRHGFRGLEAGGTALGRRRPRHWALACTQGQEHSKTSGRINFPSVSYRTTGVAPQLAGVAGASERVSCALTGVCAL